VKDLILFSVTTLGFAIVVTAHVGTVVGLARRPPRWRSLVALWAVPLAPYWAIREGLWFRAAAWLGGAGLYAFGLAAQRM
jgi:hypothetical protein